MEYKIVKFLEKIKLPYLLRCILGFFALLIALIIFVVPATPWSWLFLIAWVLLFLPANRVRFIIKIRKSFVYMFKNYKEKNILKRKMKDIKKITIRMLNEQKRKEKAYKRFKNNNSYLKMKKTKATI